MNEEQIQRGLSAVRKMCGTEEVHSIHSIKLNNGRAGLAFLVGPSGKRKRVVTDGNLVVDAYLFDFTREAA